LSALDFGAFITKVINDLTGNTKFPHPPVPLADATAAATRLQVAYPLRKNGDKAKQ